MKNSIEERSLCLKLDNCCGCRACELACSFHLSNAFNPEASAIKVNRYNGDLKLVINSSCDLCKEEDFPLCVKYCPSGALKVCFTGEHCVNWNWENES
jgi:anaerobic carbon-monoxide dehydrogenase iron sulfur subunit